VRGFPALRATSWHASRPPRTASRRRRGRATRARGGRSAPTARRSSVASSTSVSRPPRSPRWATTRASAAWPGSWKSRSVPRSTAATVTRSWSRTHSPRRVEFVDYAPTGSPRRPGKRGTGTRTTATPALGFRRGAGRGPLRRDMRGTTFSSITTMFDRGPCWLWSDRL